MDKQHQNVTELESGNLKKLLWKYFLPAFAGVVINSLYNIVDRIFIGRGVNEYALSALGSVFPIMLIIMGFGMLIGMGAGVRVSINLGKKDFNRAEKVVGTAVVLIVIISLFVTGLGYLFKGPMLQVFGAGESMSGYANDYLNIILFGTLFGMMGFSLNNVIRSEGNAKTAMFSMLISAGLNIILDPIFIFWLDMGVKGAAWATVISQLILMLWVLRHFKSPQSVVKLKWPNIRFNKEISIYIITIGFAPFAMQIAASAVVGLFNKQLIDYGGDLAVGAMSIILSFSMLSIMSMIAINMATQPVISFNHGAKNFTRVKQTLVIGMKAATLVAVASFVVGELFPKQIVAIFNKGSKELLDYGVQGLRLYMAAWATIGFQIIVSNYYQSTGKAGTAALISLLRQVIVLIPALFIVPHYLGLKGVWLCAPISDVISGIVTAIFLVVELRKLNVQIKAQVTLAK